MEQNKVAQNEQVETEAIEVAEAEVPSDKVGHLRVYKKKSTFQGAKEDDVYYSGTRSDGKSVICKFKCEVETDSLAFEISNVIGTQKTKQSIKNGVTYDNVTYYINSCTFSEIEGEELPL